MGLYNVHGNVWEWTEDCWNDSNAGNPGDGHARTAGNCTLRVVRGGSWYIDSNFLRSAIRIMSDAVNRDYGRGFRLARTLLPNAADPSMDTGAKPSTPPVEFEPFPLKCDRFGHCL